MARSTPSSLTPLSDTAPPQRTAWLWVGVGLATVALWGYIAPVLQVFLIIYLGTYLLLWPVNAIERLLLWLISGGNQLCNAIAQQWRAFQLASKDKSPSSKGNAKTAQATVDSTTTTEALHEHVETVPHQTQAVSTTGLYTPQHHRLLHRWSLMVRSLAIAIVLTTFSVVLLLTIILVGPTLLNQSQVLANELPGHLIQGLIRTLDWLNHHAGFNIWLPVSPDDVASHQTRVADWLSVYLEDWLNDHTQMLQDSLSQGSQQVWQLVTGTANGLVITVIVMACMVFSLLHGPMMAEGARYLVPEGKLRTEISWLLDEVHDVMAGFLKGQVLLGIITGIYMGIVYSAFGVKYALLLAVMFAVVEIIPVIGTWLGIIPGLLVAWMSGGLWVTLGVWVCSYGYQTLKDNLVAPKVVGDVLGLHPMAIVLAILIFGKLGSLLGVVYAIPVCALVWQCWQRWQLQRHAVTLSSVIAAKAPSS